MKNVLHSFRHSYASVGGIVQRDLGGAALLEEACHWGRAFIGKATRHSHLLFLFVGQDVNAQLLAPAPIPTCCHDGLRGPLHT